MTTGVYKIWNTSGHFYIGSAQNIEGRIQRHFRDLSRNKHNNIYFQRVFNKYGINSFKWKTIEETQTIKYARLREQEFIDKNLNKMKFINIGKTASGGDNLTRNPKRKRIIRKIKIALEKYVTSLSDEERLKRYSHPGSANGMFGKTHSAEAKIKIGKVHKNNSYNLGLKRSDEAKAKISKAAKTRASQSNYVNPFKGKRHSKQTKAALSEQALRRINSGWLPSNSRKVKIGKLVFDSASMAARKIGVVPATIINRIRSSKYPEYKYLN